MRFCGNLLPGVGFQVVRVDLEEHRGAVSSSWLRQHHGDAVTDPGTPQITSLFH